VSAWVHRLVRWRRATDLKLVGGLALVALLLLGFVELADRVTDGPLSFDEQLLVALRRPGDLSAGRWGGGFTSMMRDLTSLGSGTITGLLSVGLVGYLLLTERPWAAAFVVVAVLGAWFLNDQLKDLFARERPSVVPHLMGATHASFPSGHTMISATLYPTLAELFGRLLSRRRARLYLMAAAVALAILVGFTRIYLGVHYPSDILAGLCMGFGWALAFGLVARALQRRRVLERRGVDEDDADELHAHPDPAE